MGGNIYSYLCGMGHRAGFVNIIGKPNVGKSTLMNVLVGERLSIITSKAQTTRHRILGIVNGEDFQIVYSDTPGIVKPAYKLHESMMKFVRTSLEDADIILYLVEVGMDVDEDDEFLRKLSKVKVPVFVLINKIDLEKEEDIKAKQQAWEAALPQAMVLPISALKSINLDKVMEGIMEQLPESPPYYPKDALTDKPEKFFVTEIIREKILLNYKQEIPYSVEVVVENYQEEESIVRIRALIFVIRKSQKNIIIGKGGAAIKKVGIAARKDIEQFLDKQVYLELFVKIKENWRDNKSNLKQFGYQ